MQEAFEDLVEVADISKTDGNGKVGNTAGSNVLTLDQLGSIKNSVF